MAFALRQAGLEAVSTHRGGKAAEEAPEGAVAIHLICYASHPSESVRRYTRRKLTAGGGAGPVRHLVIDYDVAPAPSPLIAGAPGPHDCFVGDLAALCRLSAQYAVALAAPVVAQASTGT